MWTLQPGCTVVPYYVELREQLRAKVAQTPCKKLIRHWSPLVRSAFCPKEVDLTCDDLTSDSDWDHLRIDLTSKKTLHPWTLQAGSTVVKVVVMVCLVGGHGSQLPFVLQIAIATPLWQLSSRSSTCDSSQALSAYEVRPKVMFPLLHEGSFRHTNSACEELLIWI